MNASTRKFAYSRACVTPRILMTLIIAGALTFSEDILLSFDTTGLIARFGVSTQ